MKREIQDVRADVVSRPNALNGRYKAGKFGLEFWDADYDYEGPNIVRARADLADRLIAEAELSGKDVNNAEVLGVIAKEVSSIIRKEILRNRLFALVIVTILTVLVSIFLIK